MNKDIETVKISINVRLGAINSKLDDIQKNKSIILQKTKESEKKLAKECEKYNINIKEAEKNIKKRLREIEKIAKQYKKLLIIGEGIKTIVLKNGKVLFRITPPKANIKDKEKVLMELKEAKLHKLIRTIEETNKDQAIETALHGTEKEKEKLKEIKNLSITQKEELVIEPGNTPEYYVAGIKKWPVLR